VTAFLPILNVVVPFLINLFVRNQIEKTKALNNFIKWSDALKSKQSASSSLKDSYQQQIEELKKPDTTTGVTPPLENTPDVATAPEAVKTEVNWFEWCRRAIDVSKEFEGGDWANITGNFDGAYLTCGALGFTWKYNNQPPMIIDFVKRKGADEGYRLMPKYWKQYWAAAIEGENRGASVVSEWSDSKGNVREDVRKELFAFWTSPEMLKIQVETAEKMMGSFAKRKALETQDFFGLKEPQFSHYAYWFDQAVLNGTSKTIQIKAAYGVKI